MTAAGTLFDGKCVDGKAVLLEPRFAGGLSIRGEGVALELDPGSYSLSPALGSAPRFLKCSDTWVEVPWIEGVDATLGAPADGPLARMEAWFVRRTRAALAVTGILVSAWVAVIAFGAPWMARRIALGVPVSIEREAGRFAAKFLGSVKEPRLESRDLGKVEAELDFLCAARKPHIEPSIRVLGIPAPNAFALPGGTIVVTQGLMNIGLTGDEYAAVLAHEMGHLELRHGFQKLLREQSLLLAATIVTGNVSALSRFSGQLPSTLLLRGYSRAFETEADLYAVQLLWDSGIAPESLASALGKIEKASLKTSVPVSLAYFNTHPSTPDRIAEIMAEASRLKAKSAPPGPTSKAEHPK